jgi:hypothetical protein
LSQSISFAQSVKSGEHAVGLIFLAHAGQVEHISGTLSQPLVVGQKYVVTFFLRKEKTKTPSLPLGIGYKFTTGKDVFPRVGLDEFGKIDPYYQNLFGIQKICADGVVQDYIPDTNWVRLTGEYLATGGEKYITIGIFSNGKDHADIKIFNRVLNALPRQRDKLTRRGGSSRLKNFFSRRADFDYEESDYYFLDEVSVVPLEGGKDETFNATSSGDSDYYPLIRPQCLQKIEGKDGEIDKGFEGVLSITSHIEMQPDYICTILVEGKNLLSFLSENKQNVFSFDYSFQVSADLIRGKKMEIAYYKMENNDIKEIMEASTVVEKLEVSGNSVLVLQQKD